MKKYFIHDGQNESGPFSVEELKHQPVTKDSLIWYEGLDNWTPAGEINDLKSLFNLKPPPLREKAYESTITTSQFPSTPPTSNDTSPDYLFDTPKKRSFVLPIIVGAILVSGIIGWLIYENKSQAEKLDIVQQQVFDQQREQQQKEELQLQQQQQEKAEKDRKNAALTEKYMGYRNNWRSFIEVSSNNYTYSEIGGISDLAVVVYNNTDKVVDEVQVRVDYIKASGGKYKSETVQVTNIGAKSSKSVYAPTSDRGTSVKMEIESIMAKSFHFCFPYGMEGNKNFDPYFCK